MQAAVKAVYVAELAYASRDGQDMYFKKYALEHLNTLAGACDNEIHEPTKQAMRVLSVATVVCCTACIKRIHS
jgi:hypothetical protein